MSQNLKQNIPLRKIGHYAYLLGSVTLAAVSIVVAWNIIQGERALRVEDVSPGPITAEEVNKSLEWLEKDNSK